MAMKDEGLLSSREKEALEAMELELSRKDSVARQEERMAIYRMFSLPQEKLYVSCSGVDETGGELRPSPVFTLLEEYEKERGGRVLGDLGSDGVLSELVASEAGTLSYVAYALREN